MNAVAHRHDDETVLPAGLDLVPHGLLVDGLRAAGSRGLSVKEIRTTHGVTVKRVEVLITDLRRAGYDLETKRSEHDGRPWRWVLRAEPVVPAVPVEPEPTPPPAPRRQLRLIDPKGETT